MSQRGTERDRRWTQVLRRDAGADGLFVYAVRTTGVYCRPTCPARRPKPENVTFFADPAGAERAGYRACLRCAPRTLSTAALRRERVRHVCRVLSEEDPPPPLARIAAELGYSAAHLRREFVRELGIGPKEYELALRAERLRRDLPRAHSVSTAIGAAGYRASSRFYAHARELLGMTATQYRRGAPGETIRFAVGQCSLGAVLVAATERGICAVYLGAEPEELVHALEDAFPHAALQGGDAAFETHVARVIAWIEAPARARRPEDELPLDIRGTAFQRRVWQALTRIPPGTTSTYAELARELGLPNGARAVGSACARNEISVLIPCHRVVATGGKLTGYRWGIERKAALLARERRPD